jgi:hypothetical protein
MSEMVDGIEVSVTQRVADLERWKAEREKIAATADTAAIAAPKGWADTSRLSALRDVLSRPWPWVVLVVLVVVAALAPGAMREIAEAFQLARGGG